MPDIGLWAVGCGGPLTVSGFEELSTNYTCHMGPRPVSVQSTSQLASSAETGIDQEVLRQTICAVVKENEVTQYLV